MDELRREVNTIKKAVFGDTENPKDMPGIVNEIASLERRLEVTNDILKQIQGTISKLMWAVITAVVAALLKLVLIP